MFCCIAGAIGLFESSRQCAEAEVSTIQAAEQESASSTEPAIGMYTYFTESSISFVRSKVTGSHDGGFNTFQGTFVMADENPETATGKIEIDTTSIWSDNERLTNHLKSADFFEVEKYPTSIFTVKEVKKADTGYQVSGELNLHGVTKQISFPADITVQDGIVTLKSEFFIKRFDFEIKYTGKADDLIRDEVIIKLDMKATPQTAA